MDDPLGASREFRHALQGEPGRGRRLGTYTGLYDVLMSVSFRHPYYNLSHDACTDLGARPTLFTQRLMDSIGLLFRDDGAGFSVLYDTGRSEDLIAYLKRQGEAPPGEEEQFWSRLSFEVAARSPYFISVTDIPIDLNPAVQNFYFSNQTAHVEPDGEVILNPGSRVSGDELLPVIGSQFAVPVPEDVRGVMVRAISGEAVICAPRCIPPPDLPAPPMTPMPPAQCGEWLRDLPPLPAARCRDVVYLDFGLLPQGKYTIEYVTDRGSTDVGAYLYSVATPTPLAFIDLLFSPPTAQADGVYPVQGLDGNQATIVPVDYVLSFDARASFWNYYIVPQPDRYDYVDLTIESVPPAPHVDFLGPCRVVLANGAKAYRFVSDKTMGLRQQSPYRLRLRGTHGAHVLEEILMDPLPVASHRVVPWMVPDARLGLARSLLADAEQDSGCVALVGHFFGGADLPQADALARLRELRTVTQKARSPPPSRLREGAAAPPRGISDIYVYV